MDIPFKTLEQGTHFQPNYNVNHSSYANPPLKNTDCAQINKLIATDDNDLDDDYDDKTVVHFNCTQDNCKRNLNMDIQTPIDHGSF